MGSDPGVGTPRHADDATPSEERAATTSLGELMGEVSRDISTLVRQELDLAKAELRQSVIRAGRSAGTFAGAAVAGIFTLLFLSIALWWALGYLVGNAWSAVIVAAVWAIVAGVLALVGKRELDEIRGMPDTVDSIKKIPDTLKRNEENR